MITVRKANERGLTELGWLKSFHSFSFGEYYDPAHMGFRGLRVINDDIVAPGSGFGTHPHRDMEIVTVVLSGELEHRDSLSHAERLRPGEVQVMSAGTGIRHSEMNPSRNEPVRLIQIWIEPARAGTAPSYAQRAFPLAERRGAFQLVAGPRNGVAKSSSDAEPLSIGQDARVLLCELASGQSAKRPIAAGRAAWVQVATGELSVNGVELREGDGAALEGDAQLELRGRGAGGFAIVFDLP